jgi:GNAT superfamily N-acetyltransferase
MREGSDYSYRVLRAGDDREVKALVKAVFGGFLGGDYWDWKYRHNPYFDPSLVAVAEKDGKIVGCNHWLVRDLKFSDALVVRAVLGADIAVSPEHRRQGLGKSLLLFLRSSKTFARKKVVMSYMFPNPEMIESLYRPSAFYVPTPSSMVSYVKILNWNKLKQRLESTNKRLGSCEKLRRKASKLNVRVLFEIEESPPLPLRISDGRIEIDEANKEKPDVVFRIDLKTFESLRGARNKTWRLVKAWLWGRLEIKSGLLSLFKLYRNSWIFNEIFS